jgi:hypothetical protein
LKRKNYELGGEKVMKCPDISEEMKENEENIERMLKEAQIAREVPKNEG